VNELASSNLKYYTAIQKLCQDFLEIFIMFVKNRYKEKLGVSFFIFFVEKIKIGSPKNGKRRSDGQEGIAS